MRHGFPGHDPPLRSGPQRARQRSPMAQISADRQGTAARRRAGGRAGQADRGGPVRRSEAHRSRPEPSYRRADRPGAGRRGRQEGQGPPARGQPPAGGVAGQAVHRPRDAVPGPDPGGQPGPDPRHGKVALTSGNAIVKLRQPSNPAAERTPGNGVLAANTCSGPVCHRQLQRSRSRLLVTSSGTGQLSRSLLTKGQPVQWILGHWTRGPSVRPQQHARHCGHQPGR
jgi:hypothetical protein